MTHERRNLKTERRSQWLERKELTGKPLWKNVGSWKGRMRGVELGSWERSCQYEGNDWWSLIESQE